MMLSGRSVSTGDRISDRGPSLTAFIIVVLLIHGSFEQDIIFPDYNPATSIHAQIHSTNRNSASSKNRTSSTHATAPIKCGENMILMKISKTENFCECLEGYLYHLKSDHCYKSHTRGPCDNGDHFILRANRMRAECVRNPCETEDEVFFKGSCHGLLLSGGPCSSHETLVISETSHEPVCRSIGTDVYQLINVPLIRCAPGSRRDGRGKCRPKL